MARLPSVCATPTCTGRRAAWYWRFTTATDTAGMVLRARARGAAWAGSSLLSTGGQRPEACFGRPSRQTHNPPWHRVPTGTTAQGHGTVLLAQEATLRLALAGEGEGGYPIT